MNVERQRILPISDTGHTLESSFRIDLLMNNVALVECKAVSLYQDIFRAQVLTCLRLMNLKPGLVINFDEKLERTAL